MEEQNWKDLSFYEVLSESFIEEHKDKVDWNRISAKQQLSIPFIEKMKSYINFHYLTANPCVTMAHVHTFEEENWDWHTISSKFEMTENEIEHFQDKVQWKNVSWHQTLSENFIATYKDHVDWRWIIEKQKVSYEFLLKHQEYLKNISTFYLEGNSNIQATAIQMRRLMKILQKG